MTDGFHWNRLAGPLLALALLIALPLVAEALGERFYISFASRILIFALAAISLDLILGYGGMVSFGHAAFYGIGAYTMGILAVHAQDGTALFFLDWSIGGSNSLYLHLPAAMLVAGLAALVIGLVVLRTTGIHFIMITLAFAQMVYFLFVSMEGYHGDDGLTLYQRSDSLGLLKLSDRTSLYYLILGCLLLCYGFLKLATAARFGMTLTGIRSNQTRMEAIGVPTFRYRLAAFVIAGAMCGLAGALTANLDRFVSPSLMHWTRSGELLIMVILGGMGRLYGAVLGAALFLILQDILPGLLDRVQDGWGQHWQVAMGPILILIVLYARGGVAGLIESGWRKVRGHG